METIGITPANHLLDQIEAGRMWAYFHKDWLLQIRGLIRSQLPVEFSVFVESEAVLIAPTDHDLITPVAPDLAVVLASTAEMQVQDFGHPTAAVVDVEEACELIHQYRLVIRRVPDNQVVAAAELLSPTNKGVFGELEKTKYLRKRDQYLDAGVNLLEIDALRKGDRLLPPMTARLADYDRNVWSVCHDSDRRRYRGWGWNGLDPLPTVTWAIEPSRHVIVDLAEAFRQACEFNPWERLVKPS